MREAAMSAVAAAREMGDEQRLQEERAEVGGAACGACGGELRSVDLREEGVQVVHGLRRAEAAEGTEDDGQEGALLGDGAGDAARCLLFFSAARAVKRAVASVAAAGAKVGRNGQETVTSMAVTGG